MRSAAVAASAQALSYGVFAGLIVTVLASLPQLAVIAGSVAGAIVSYTRPGAVRLPAAQAHPMTDVDQCFARGASGRHNTDVWNEQRHRG